MRGTCPVQETIKVRERIPHIGLIPQDNPSKSLLDQVLLRMLLARCVDVFVGDLFCVASFQSEGKPSMLWRRLLL